MAAVVPITPPGRIRLKPDNPLESPQKFAALWGSAIDPARTYKYLLA
jgi:hypothetical protein